MSRSLRILPTIALTLLLATTADAQVAFDGRPWARHGIKLGLEDAPVFKRAALDRDALLAEDELRAADGNKRMRFGVNHEVDLTTDNSGMWSTLPNGDRVWRITIDLKDAYSVNFEFSTFIVPEGGKVYAYTPAGEVLGAFTAESNPGHQELGVGLLPGERITVEYDEPAAVAGQGFLRIGRVTQGYRDSFASEKGFGASQSCNNNVICPEGDPWRDQIRSVARIVVNGGDWCTGQLINNCTEDGTPYFLTANHCLGGNVGTWVFAFNWESTTCATNTNTPMNQTTSGAQLLESSGGSDVALLRLNTTPPASYGVYYGGWDATGAAPVDQVGIHHPSGDQKKICFNGETSTTIMTGGAECWRVNAWDDGTTEGGSSGSALWDPQGRIVGQLFSGTPGCNATDNYGKFSVSYPLIQQHIGSCGPVLDGYDPNNEAQANDAGIQSIQDIDAVECNAASIQPTVVIRNTGNNALTALTLDWTVTGGGNGGHPWTGNLAPGATASVDMPTVAVNNGANTYSVTATQPNGTNDPNINNNSQSFNFTVANPGVEVEFQLTFDEYGSETSWEILADGSSTAIASGSGYPDDMSGEVEIENVCLPEGCYTLVVHDEYGDGICCDYGDGSYVLLANGVVLVEGDGIFEDEASHDFCVTATGVHELGANGISVWPNPAAGRFEIALASFNGPVTIEVMDAIGRRVANERRTAFGAPMVLDLSGEADGVYLLKVTAGTHVLNERIIIRR